MALDTEAKKYTDNEIARLRDDIRRRNLLWQHAQTHRAGGGDPMPTVASSPLNTKGDIHGYSGSDARVPIGADTFVLTADSAQALGLKWAAAAGGGPSLADTFVTIGNPADLSASLALTAGSGVSVTQAGANPNKTVTLALANLTANWAQAGAFDIYHAGALGVGSSSAPLNTTAGDITGTRLSLGNAAAFSGTLGLLANLTVTQTETAAASVAIYLNPTFAPASNSTATFTTMQIDNIVAPPSGVTIAGVTGFLFQNFHRSDAAITTMINFLLKPVVLNSLATGTLGTITTAEGFRIIPYARQNGTATVSITNLTAINIVNIAGAGLTCTTFTGLSIANWTANTLTNFIGIDIASLTRGGTLNIGIRNADRYQGTKYMSLLGSTVTPTNVTAGDFTAIRGLFGSDIAFPAGGVQLMAQQGTLGNEVMRLASTATNDDPTMTSAQNKVLTTDATATVIQTMTIPASTTVLVWAFVTARRTGGTAGTAEDGAGYSLSATFKLVAGAAVQIGATTNLSLAEDQVLWDCVFDVNAATARVKVTGAALNNISWSSTVLTFPMGT